MVVGGPTCVVPEPGSPCDEQNDCLAGYECLEVEEGERCVIARVEGDTCSDWDPLVVCVPGTVCNHATNPPTCTIAGKAGHPCGLDGDCIKGYSCLEERGVCSGGLPGEPCDTDGDCLSEGQCSEAESGLLCIHHHKEGESCEPDLPYEPCLPWLQCNPSYDPPQCASPGEDGAPCLGYYYCAEGYKCLDSIKQCFNGDDGDYCGLGTDCAPGYHCVGSADQCHNGDTGDLCDGPEDCAKGFECDEKEARCYMGGHGKPCHVDVDCPAGLSCSLVENETRCFEFLDGGVPCGSAGPPYSACADGLVCDDSLEPPLCAFGG